MTHQTKSLYQNEERVRCRRFGGAARREEGEYPLWIFDRRATPQRRQRSGNPEGCFLAGAWRRCSSVRERCGYLPSSRLASRPPENSALIPHFDIGSKFLDLNPAARGCLPQCLRPSAGGLSEIRAG